MRLRTRLQRASPADTPRPAVVNITLAAHAQLLFHTATAPGTTPDNDTWVARKRAAVKRLQELGKAAGARRLVVEPAPLSTVRQWEAAACGARVGALWDAAAAEVLAREKTWAAPAPAADAAQLDTSSHCGQWDTVSASPYSLLLDQWGASGATSGSQCANLISLSGSTISWTTTWTWTGGTGVKSFTNIQLNDGINQQLSAISSMPVRTTGDPLVPLTAS